MLAGKIEDDFGTVWLWKRFCTRVSILSSVTAPFGLRNLNSLSRSRALCASYSLMMVAVSAYSRI